MLFSLKELRRMANLPAEMSDQLVVDALVQLGFEVESQVRFPLVEGVKFGRVHAVEPNPSADRLAVCQVVFNDQTRTIQTSATNVRVGAVVAAFVSGSRLGETVFSPRKMQGVVSEGMLISLSEVGYASALLGPLGQGITLFEAEMDLDHDPVDLLGLNDTLLDITVLPNRPNSRCYQAIARELAAFFHRQVPREHWNKFRAQGSLKVSVPAGNEYVLIGANADFKLTWAEKLLIVKSGFALGNKINNLINLTLLMSGLPISVYDQDKIGNSLALVRVGEENLAWGDRRYALNQHLVVRDKSQIIGLAGLGPIDFYRANELTKRLVIEVAVFNRADVLKNLALTASSGVNAHGQIHSRALGIGAVLRALSFLESRLDRLTSLTGFKLPPRRLIALDNQTLTQVAGQDISQSDKFVAAMLSLETIGFEIDRGKIALPYDRQDVVDQFDLASEILRFYGLNFLKPRPPLPSRGEIVAPEQLVWKLVGFGLSQVVSYLLVDWEANRFDFFKLGRPIKLLDYPSKLYSSIRNSLVSSFLPIVDYHLKRKITRLGFFEIGQVYLDTQVLGLCQSETDFETFKAKVVALCPPGVTFAPSSYAYLHPGQSAEIYLGKQKIGYLGQLHPAFYDQPVYFAEINLTTLAKVKSERVSFTPYLNQPLKVRDLTVSLKASQSIATITAQIKAIPGVWEIEEIGRYLKKDGQVNVSLRVSGDEKAIASFEKQFYNS